MKQTYQELVVNTNNIAFVSDFIFAFDVDAIEENNGQLIVRTEEYPDSLVYALDELTSRMREIDSSFQLNYTISEKPNKDWIAEYQKNIQPIRVGNFYIHTSWQPPVIGCKNIKIDPALAFGSGHHESTNACLQAIERYAGNAQTALDVGCGSGILSLALAMSSICVDACDTDELAIMSTKSNFALNNLNISNIWLGSASKTNKTYDLVVANIIADVILIIKDDLLAALANDGTLILSGILGSYLHRIKEQFQDLNLLEEIQLGDWCTLIYKA